MSKLQMKNWIWLFAIFFVALPLASCETKEAPQKGEGATKEAEKGVKLPWRSDYDAALADAKRDQKPVILDFTADWCSECQALDKNLQDPEVAKALERFVRVKLDGTDQMEALEPTMAKHGVETFPALAFVDSKGNLLNTPFIEEAIPAPKLLEAFAKVK